MMNVIEIDHLTYSYPGAEQPTLKGITVKIKKGDFLAIVGNNGCGKSTFCKTLNGLIPQFISGDFQGSVRACDLDTRETDVGTLARMSIRILKIKSFAPRFWMTLRMPA